ncbi:MAG: PIN domain-containing protein [Oxalobacter sp.]|nr:MAG: PIN domain-containing protein [Oxalobacter sp.]
MPCYVDTSALVALFMNEEHSEALGRWYARSKSQLIASTWCVTEFASALAIKQRTGQISEDEARLAWQSFERLCANDLSLLPPSPATFHHAALLTLDAQSGLRAGDALHLACALEAKARTMLTLDEVFAKNAKRLKMTLVKL